MLFDTSAIAKRYRDEQGHDQVQQWLERADGVVMAAHARMEVAASLCRDLHDGATTQADLQADLQALAQDFDGFDVMPLDSRIEALSTQAMAGARLRAMDALHIATAQAAGVDMFITADKHQAQAAEALAIPTFLVQAA
ncbi:type II toxin-antitoxin system VapC family toxin [Pseudorhodoferax sp.]|uniref:type II toxin-antitoxin system VapC family toxin n=1 Tax=Pseudorhodoferax sp. TaxID=1993553 RepID=UPI0039E6799D